MSIWDLISGAAAGGTNYFLQNQDIDRIEDLGKDAYEGAFDLGELAFDRTQFEPYTITSSFGSGTFNPGGGGSIGLDQGWLDAMNYGVGQAGNLASRLTDPNFITDRVSLAGQTMGTGNYTPSAEWQSLFGTLGQRADSSDAYQQLMNSFGGRQGAPDANILPALASLPGPDAQSVMSQLDLNRVSGNNAGDILSLMGGGTDRDEARIYEMLEGMQEPGRERGRLELENRLFGQGRTGVQTDAYGGTPEQLAMEKAIQESKSTNAFNAYKLAQDEAYRDRTARADEVSAAYGLGLQERGQDITQTDILGRLGLGAFDTALTQRGQDLADRNSLAELRLGEFDRALAERGQNISETDILGRLGLGAFDRGLAERGLNIDENFNLAQIGLGSLDRALTERGQDIGQQDIFANQALRAYETALMEQGLLGDQMSNLVRTSLLPQQLMLQELGLGADLFEIGQRGNLAGAELALTAGLGGLDALTNFESIAASARSNRDRDLANLLMGSPESDQQGLFDLLAGLFG